VRIVLSSPTYGYTLPEAARALRVAIMHAASNGIEFAGDASTDRLNYAAARNQAARAAVQAPGVDGIVWADDDVVFPASAITRLVKHGLDYVSGIYFSRAEPYLPQIYSFSRARESFIPCIQYPANVLAPMDSAGFGCCYTSTRMLTSMMTLKDVQKHDPRDPPAWFRWGRYGEDFDFALKAKEAGFQLYVDTGLLCGHLRSPEAITEETYKANIQAQGGLGFLLDSKGAA